MRLRRTQCTIYITKNKTQFLTFKNGLLQGFFEAEALDKIDSSLLYHNFHHLKAIPTTIIYDNSFFYFPSRTLDQEGSNELIQKEILFQEEEKIQISVKKGLLQNTISILKPFFKPHIIVPSFNSELLFWKHELGNIQSKLVLSNKQLFFHLDKETSFIISFNKENLVSYMFLTSIIENVINTITDYYFCSKDEAFDFIQHKKIIESDLVLIIEKELEPLTKWLLNSNHNFDKIFFSASTSSLFFSDFFINKAKLKINENDFSSIMIIDKLCENYPHLAKKELTPLIGTIIQEVF